MIKAGIIGAAGYTGGELIRILATHPEVELVYAHSRSQAGAPLSEWHEGLLGGSSLCFSGELRFDFDVLFLCMGHGESAKLLAGHELPERLLVIDLSQDFRWAPGFVYGLPELQRAAIRQSRRIANPGCFATAIQLALLPLAQARLLQADVHVNAITGSTGAGQAPQATTHFSWRNNNVSVYKPFGHQHLAEIRQSLAQLQPGFGPPIHFIPWRGNFSRGIFASLYTDTNLSQDELFQLYEGYYADHPFVQLSRQNPSLKAAVNTNQCVLHLEKHEDKVLIVSIIDNLLKGASGQAVQNMNLALGLEEEAGLRLKAVGY
jgi:N-acetyl-gamma-glutamyl-phosphate reductase